MSNQRSNVKELTDQLVHFPTKISNSKVEPGGIRLGKDEYRSDLPYVSITSSLNDDVEVDYTVNATTEDPLRVDGEIVMANEEVAGKINEKRESNKKPTIGITGNMKTVSTLKETNPTHIIVNEYDKEISKRKEILPSFLNKRLKQVLLPEENGYVSATPLNSLSLNAMALEELEILRKAKGTDELELYLPRKVSLPYGGSKPQNVGNLAFGKNRALIFNAPSRNSQIRYARKIFFYEKLSAPWVLLNKLKKINEKQRHNSDIGVEAFTSQNNREEINSVLNEIVDSILRTWEEYSEIVQTCGYLEPDPKLSHIRMGLLFPQMRDEKWVNDVSNILGKNIVDFKDRDGNRMILDADTEDFIVKRFKKILLGRI